MAENGKTTAALAMPGAAVGNRGIVIQNFDDLARFAKMVESSSFAPKNMNAAAIGVAIQMGYEVGLTPMQALQSTAVINGRPGVYGDAAKALIEGSGLMVEYEQWYELDGKRLRTSDGHNRTPTADEMKKDTLTCCVLSTRKNRKPLVSTFSVGDAKAAGLWGKAGPWMQYPARMLMFRARGFNLRDNFGDVLKGLRTVEELRDEPVTASAAPAPASLEQRLKQRAAALPAADTVEALPVQEGDGKDAAADALAAAIAEDDATQAAEMAGDLYADAGPYAERA